MYPSTPPSLYKVIKNAVTVLQVVGSPAKIRGSGVTPAPVTACYNPVTAVTNAP
jgi:hypothetical protein